MNAIRNLLLVAASGVAMLTLSSCVTHGGGKGCCAKQTCCCHGGKEACCGKGGAACCKDCGHCAR